MSAVLTENKEFVIKKNMLYRIYEKVDAATPIGLKEIHRYKEVATTIEPARCLYIGSPENGRYDTGFDTSSIDFRSMDPAAAKKILAERKELAELFKKELEAYLQRYPNRTETDFLASDRAGLDLKHGMVIDTSSIYNWLKLYFAFRGGRLTPSNDIKNPKYNSSLFVIAPLTNDTQEEESKFKKEIKVLTWYGNKQGNDLETVIKTLQFVGALAHGRTATPTVVQNQIKKWITNIDNLNELVRVIDTVDKEELLIKVKIGALVHRRVITRENGIYYYKGNAVGKSQSDIYYFILKPENENLLDGILNEK